MDLDLTQNSHHNLAGQSKHCRATAESWKAFDQQIKLNNSQMENRLKSI
jgi:hypothetical protein